MTCFACLDFPFLVENLRVVSLNIECSLELVTKVMTKTSIGPHIVETLTMLDKICTCPALDESIVTMLGDITRTLETL